MSDRKRPDGLRCGPAAAGAWRRTAPAFRALDEARAALGGEARARALRLLQGQRSRGRVWTYLGYGPFADDSEFRVWLEAREASRDPWFYALSAAIPARPPAWAPSCASTRANGVIEIGHIWMSPGLQKTREATEAIYLMMRHGFDELGVRRLEWKCDLLNAPSRKAAERFGFTFEGIFRQHFIIKGRNRDTAWFAMIDTEWPAMRGRFRPG